MSKEELEQRIRAIDLQLEESERRQREWEVGTFQARIDALHAKLQRLTSPTGLEVPPEDPPLLAVSGYRNPLRLPPSFDRGTRPQRFAGWLRRAAERLWSGGETEWREVERRGWEGCWPPRMIWKRVLKSSPLARAPQKPASHIEIHLS